MSASIRVRLGWVVISMAALLGACSASEGVGAKKDAGTTPVTSGSGGSSATGAAGSTGSGGSSSTGGSTGSGGSTSTGGSGGTSTGGSGGSDATDAGGGSGGFSDVDAGSDVSADTGPTYVTPYCTPTVVSDPLIADFTYTDGADKEKITWGDYSSSFSGYTYWYPSTVVSDVSTGAWHLTGMVTDYAGFAMGFACKTDAHTYTGISFTIKGNAGTPNSVGFYIGSAPTDLATMDPAGSWGTCVPKNNQYDGTCVTPAVTIPLTATATPHKLKWADLMGGKPSGVDPAQLTRIGWTLAWAGAASTPYAIDVTIDDVKFTTD